MSINQLLDQLGNENKNEFAEFPNTLSETDNKDPDEPSKYQKLPKLFFSYLHLMLCLIIRNLISRVRTKFSIWNETFRENVH